jgi:hypothetical protein
MSADGTPALPKGTMPASIRRVVLFLVEIACWYGFVWVPWRVHPGIFLLFVGAGMIQTAATYTQEWNPAVTPPIFMSVIAKVIVGLFALGLLVTQIVVGFDMKPWWEALLLLVSPFLLSGLWYRNHNPAPPFFTGLAALVAALGVALVG